MEKVHVQLKSGQWRRSMSGLSHASPTQVMPRVSSPGSSPLYGICERLTGGTGGLGCSSRIMSCENTTLYA